MIPAQVAIFGISLILFTCAFLEVVRGLNLSQKMGYDWYHLVNWDDVREYIFFGCVALTIGVMIS